MSTQLLRLSACLVASFLAAAPLRAAAADFAGAWEISVGKLDTQQDLRLTLQQNGADYSGTAGAMKFSGRVEHGRLRLLCLNDASCGELSLQITGAVLKGEGTLKSVPVTVRGARPTVRPYAAARTFDFVPHQYYGQFAGSIPAALTIFPGDSVHTTTLDAEGFDEQAKKISAFINPQTGPFYIENAMPGDTLAIHFTRIRTNRATADMYGDVIAPNALDPYAPRQEEGAHGSGTWNLHADQGRAVLTQPTAKLAEFSVPMKPMLGCVGVAPPAHQSIRTVNLGVYGGNLDYSGIHEGATLFLPVFQKGALLFIGDGHALQGDGELTGTGLETSMDVAFTVDLYKDHTLGQPRTEDDDYVMVSGIGGSISDALQLATSGMIRWLNDTYHLNSHEAAMVLGTSMHYDVTELVDPQFHVVAKLPKNVLARIRVE